MRRTLIIALVAGIAVVVASPAFAAGQAPVQNQNEYTYRQSEDCGDCTQTQEQTQTRTQEQTSAGIAGEDVTVAQDQDQLRLQDGTRDGEPDQVRDRTGADESTIESSEPTSWAHRFDGFLSRLKERLTHLLWRD